MVYAKSDNNRFVRLLVNKSHNQRTASAFALIIRHFIILPFKLWISFDYVQRLPNMYISNGSFIWFALRRAFVHAHSACGYVPWPFIILKAYNLLIIFFFLLPLSLSPSLATSFFISILMPCFYCFSLSCVCVCVPRSNRLIYMHRKFMCKHYQTF